MNNLDKQYQELLQDILENSVEKTLEIVELCQCLVVRLDIK